jgi:ABC-2 type transport system ATP-binding protein
MYLYPSLKRKMTGEGMDNFSDQEIAVWVKGLRKEFGNFVAVAGIDFEVKKGEIFGFLGPNGAGKSTTIKMLCGIMKPTSGMGKVNGKDIFDEPEEIKASIGYMSQRFSLYEDLTVMENLNFYAGIYRIPKEKREMRKLWVLEMADLKGKERKITRTLATGWKQRLALGCAILHEPPILFLDEPTSGVDPISRMNFWELIYNLSREGVTIFVTTHYMDEVQYCDRLALIFRGRIIAMGRPFELRMNGIKGVVMEIECNKNSEAMELLQKRKEFDDVSFFGNKLHVISQEMDGIEGLIREILKKGNIKVVRIERITPSIEDVFIHLIEKEASSK